MGVNKQYHCIVKFFSVSGGRSAFAGTFDATAV